MAGLHMILHIIHVVVRDDNVGTRIANHVGHGVNLRLIVAVHLHIRNVNVENFFGTDKLAGIFRFLFTDLAQRAGFNNDMALITVCNMAHIHICALLYIFAECTRAGDLQIVGVAANRQNSHVFHLLLKLRGRVRPIVLAARPCGRINTPRVLLPCIHNRPKCGLLSTQFLNNLYECCNNGELFTTQPP